MYFESNKAEEDNEKPTEHNKYNSFYIVDKNNNNNNNNCLFNVVILFHFCSFLIQKTEEFYNFLARHKRRIKLTFYVFLAAGKCEKYSHSLQTGQI